MAQSNTAGAVRPAVRSAPMKVVVFQWPCGTADTSRSPWGARPRVGGINRGYKFHAVHGRGVYPLLYRVEPLNVDERPTACAVMKQLAERAPGGSAFALGTTVRAAEAALQRVTDGR